MLLGLPLLLAGFVLGLVVFAPANKLLGLFQSQVPPQVQLQGVDGRLLQGHAAQVQAQGLSLSPLVWQLNPLAFLSGKLAARLQGDLPSGDTVRTQVSASPSGVIDLTDLRMQMSIKDIAGLAKQPFVPVAGSVQLSLDQARLEAHGKPSAIQGRLDIVDLQWTLLKPDLPLGNYTIQLRTDSDGTIRGDISDRDATLSAQGEVSLTPDGRYKAQVQLKPGPDTPAMIRNGLANMSRPNPQGEYSFSYTGQVPGW
jgi:hypothetical protein